ncbi:Kelch repeat-containing protein [Glaciecola sp. SC05]|uniref:Kelch repeat-containing protein n=1 Tax=Glaciecola sp. SC05 TaxID=1987355 RepID=UPI003527D793
MPSLTTLKLMSVVLLLSLFSKCQLVNAQKNWELLETNLVPRHESTLVSVNGALYLLGGRRDKPIEKYDSKNALWKHVLPQTPLELHHFQALAWQDNIYILGAFTGSYPNETGVENVLVFNTNSNQLTRSTTMPKDRIRGGASAAVYNDNIYLVGGIVNGHLSGSVSWFDKYNPKTQSFVRLPDAPNSRDHAAAAVVGDKLYVLGGRKTSAATGQTFELTVSQVDVFDFHSQTWQTLPESMNLPTPRAGANVVVVEKDIWVIGGESGSQKQAHAEVEVLNTHNLTWSNAPPLNIGRHSGGASLHQGAIYVVSGSGRRGGRPELSNMERLTIPLR